MQTSTRKKMLYIMGIDWNWICQRPQILAEYLSKDYDITVAYPVKVWDRPVPRRGRRKYHKASENMDSAVPEEEQDCGTGRRLVCQTASAKMQAI